MDPNAMMEEIQDNLRYSKDSVECAFLLEGACEDLNEWLSSGGFSPDWEAFSESAVTYFLNWRSQHNAA